jgi:PEP-CTERM motif
MVGITKSFTVLVCLAILGFGSSIARAGILDGNGSAISGWTGSSSFDNGSGLVGYVDYAVFTKSTFESLFGTDDFTPVDDVVYTYQVYSTGTDSLSAKIVGNTAESNSIGWFDNVVGGDRIPTAYFYDTGSPVWSFIGNAVQPGESSVGLVFTSPFLPTTGGGFVIDGGGLTPVMGIPVPGSVQIPEPASWLLATLGMVAFGFFRRSWR